MKATAVKRSENGAATTRFSVSAENQERIEEFVADMGAELLDTSDLGHEGHQPLPEELYSAATWEYGSHQQAA